MLRQFDTKDIMVKNKRLTSSELAQDYLSGKSVDLNQIRKQSELEQFWGNVGKYSLGYKYLIPIVAVILIFKKLFS